MMNERFFRTCFRLAALYNITAGIIVIFFPQIFFHAFHLPEINYPYVMNGLGMFVAIYGYGFYLVSCDLQRHYHFALLGLAGKSFAVLGWLYYTMLGIIPLTALWANFFNDIVWIPFFIAYIRWRKQRMS